MHSCFRSNLCFSSFLEGLDSLSANMEISVEPGSERKNQGAQLSSSCSQSLDNFTHMLCFLSPHHLIGRGINYLISTRVLRFRSSSLSIYIHLLYLSQVHVLIGLFVF